MRSVMKKDFTAKVAIMYIIDKNEEAVDEEILTDAAISVCEMNYFIFRQYLYELIQTNFIRHYSYEKLEYYVLTEKGKQALEHFTPKLPYSLRVRLTEAIHNGLSDLKTKNSFSCDYVPVSDLEYNVKLSYNEGTQPIMQMELRAGDKEQAKDLMRVLYKNKERIYTDIYNYVMKLAAEDNGITHEQPGESETVNEINFFN